MDVSTKGKAKNILLFVGSFILICLLFIALIRNANGYSHITFTNFLNYISSSPKLIPILSIDNFVITGSWGIFNQLKNFLNIFTQLFGIVVWFGSSLLNIILYLFYFLKFIFVF